MDIKQLRTFVAIVDCQGFSSAANKLNISQATTSTHLSQLESELGVQLILRSTQSIEVTQAGWTVYKYARHILEIENCIHESCAAKGRNLLRIGASTLPATYMLPEIIEQYGACCTKDLVRITQCENKDVVDGVLDGRFDVGLTSLCVHRDGLEYIPICSDKMVIITPVTDFYQRFRGKRHSVLELLEAPIILREECGGRQVDLCLERMGVDPRNLDVVARVNDQEAVKNMVASGIGVSIISQIAAHDFIQSKRVLKFDIPQFNIGKDIYLVYPTYYTSKHPAWRFIDYVQHFGGAVWKSEMN